MNEIHIKRTPEHDLPEAYNLAHDFGHNESFYSLLHSGISYSVLDDSHMIGIITLLRQVNHWNFTIYSIDLSKEIITEENYMNILGFILHDIKFDGGYTIDIVDNNLNEHLIKALKNLGFSLTSDSVCDRYTLNQAILF